MHRNVVAEAVGWAWRTVVVPALVFSEALPPCMLPELRMAPCQTSTLSQVINIAQLLLDLQGQGGAVPGAAPPAIVGGPAVAVPVAGGGIPASVLLGALPVAGEQPPQGLPAIVSVKDDLDYHIPARSGFGVGTAELPEGVPHGSSVLTWAVTPLTAPGAARFVVVDPGVPSCSTVSMFIQRPYRLGRQVVWRSTPVLQGLITEVQARLLEEDHGPHDDAPPAAAPPAAVPPAVAAPAAAPAPPSMVEVPPPGAGAGSGVGCSDVEYSTGPHHVDILRNKVGQVVAYMVDLVNSNRLRCCDGAQPPQEEVPGAAVQIGAQRAIVETRVSDDVLVARTLSCPFILLGKRAQRCVGCSHFHRAQVARDVRRPRGTAHKRGLEVEAGSDADGPAGNQDAPNKVAKAAAEGEEEVEDGGGAAPVATPPKAKRSKEASPPPAAEEPRTRAGKGEAAEAADTATGVPAHMLENLLAAHRRVAKTEVRELHGHGHTSPICLTSADPASAAFVPRLG